MSSQEPGEEASPEGPAAETEAEEPAAAEVEEPVEIPDEDASIEEEYEELIEPEKPRRPRKERRHIGAIITVVVILIILVVWTLLSPNVMPQVGTTYVRHASGYENLANFTGDHESWAANTTWGISVSGPRSASVNENLTLRILVSKISERPSSFWFRGTAISVTNMTLWLTNATGHKTAVAYLNNQSDLGYGKLGTLTPISFADPGSYRLNVTVQFLVYADMRIGFLPVEKISLAPLQLELISVASNQTLTATR